MQHKFEVGTAIGIKDPVYGTPAHAIICDGDSVLCCFFGSDAEDKCKAVCDIINSAQELLS